MPSNIENRGSQTTISSQFPDTMGNSTGNFFSRLLKAHVFWATFCITGTSLGRETGSWYLQEVKSDPPMDLPLKLEPQCHSNFFCHGSILWGVIHMHIYIFKYTCTHLYIYF